MQNAPVNPHLGEGVLPVLSVESSALLAHVEAHAEAHRQRWLEEQRKIERAERRAVRLLCRYLDAKQRWMFTRHRRFWVEGGESGNLFLVHDFDMQNISEFGPGGEKVAIWCLDSDGDEGELPMADLMLLQKVMIESEESAFREIANWWDAEDWRRDYGGDWQSRGENRAQWRRARAWFDGKRGSTDTGIR